MSEQSSVQHNPDTQAAGYAYALAAFIFWGFAPMYFVWVGFAEPLEVLAQRIIWSIPFIALLITFAGQWQVYGQLTLKTYLTLAVCSALLSANWLTFIYAIHAGRIVETSLGYFMNPLVSILLGRLFLAERLRPWQWAAVGMAALGVVGELVTAGEIPQLGLILAFSFGFYGLLRKQLAVPSSVGLGVETLLVFPLAVGYLVYGMQTDVIPIRDISEYVKLGLGGIVTVLPLLWFAAATLRIPLTTLGFFQYIAPSISLLLGVLYYNESVSVGRWLGFSCIWLALVLFSFESLFHARQQKTQPA